MMEEGPLEELENLLKSNFSDLLVSLAVSAKGSLFLSAWQQPSELSSPKIFMEYLPLFYLIASIEDQLKLSLKLISYHGIVIDDLYEKDDQPLTDQEKVCFIKKLVDMQLCAGVNIPGDLKADSSHLIEKLEQNVIVRSRHCSFGLDSGRKICEACKNLNREIVSEKRKNVVPLLDIKEDNCSAVEHSYISDISVQKQSENTIENHPPHETIEKAILVLASVKVETKDDENVISNDSEAFDMETADKLMEQAGSLLSYPTVEKDDIQSEEMHQTYKTRKAKRTNSKRLRVERSKGHHQVGPFLCDQCGQTFTYADELKIHLDETSHQSKETAVCFQCGDILDSRIAFRKHLWLHENFRPYKCRHCDFSSTVQEHVFNQHAIYIHGSVGTEDDIEYLTKVMEKIDDYEQDNNLHLGAPLTKNRTRKVRKMKRRKMKHSMGSRLQHSCSQPNCHMRYHSYKDLKKHYQETGHRAKHVCFLCGEVAPRDVYLRNHIISVHLELKPYQCVHCPFTSALPDKIYNGHYKRIHGDGYVGTKQDVTSLPEVLKVIEEFEKENTTNLLGLSMMPPPLEEWPCKGDTDYEQDDRDSSSPIKRTKKSTFSAEDDVKLEAFETTNRNLYESDNLDNLPIPDIKTFKMDSDNNSSRDKKPKSTGKFRQQCNICLFAFDAKEAFDNDQEKHRQQLVNQEAVNCPTCAVTVPKIDLNQHYVRDHAELKAGCCLECLIVVVPRIKMQRHFVTIHKPKNLCPICGKHFRVVKDHMAVKHSNNVVKDHICEVCGKKFRHALLLQSHVAKMHTVRKSFPCKFCGQLFKEKCTLTTHYWSMHMKVKPYKCKHCSYEAAQTQRIYEHCRTVHKIKGCKDDVERLESVFEKIKQFEIQHGLNRQDLKNIKEFVCWICKEQFRNNHDRTKHELDHLNMYPYECKTCLNRFKLKNALKRHYEQVHQDYELMNSPIEMVPELSGLYARLRRIPGNLIETYQQYKEMNQVVFKNDKPLKKIRCKKCGDTSSDNIAEFLHHFHTAHGHEFSESSLQGNDPITDIVGGSPQDTLTCKCCGFETINPGLLMRHVGEVHNLMQQEYEDYVEAPKVEPTQRIFSPRKYRCRYCLEYTAVKKCTVHNHIKNAHNIQQILDHDVLLISESDHLLHQLQ